MTALPATLRLIDPHIHQWDPLRTPREVSLPAKAARLLPPLRRLVPHVVPQSDREFVGDPRYVLAPYLPHDYTRDAADLPVEAIVHVQAGWHGHVPMDSVAETRWIAGLPFGSRGAPALGGIVSFADPRWPQIGDVLDAHGAASPAFRGVRCMATHHSDPGVRSWTDREHLLTDADFLRGFAAIAERGLSFEVWVYSRQLRDVLTLAREYPEATLVLDHYATPVGLFGPRGKATGHSEAQRTAILDAWRDDLAAVAEHPNVVAKHSGLGMPILGWRAPVGRGVTRAEAIESMRPVVTHTEESFGPGRTMWASNYPMDKPIVALPEAVGMLAEILGDTADAAAVFAGTARRVYRVDEVNRGSA
jgi:predicted TIM-barrel fold metal-dependent hydrolase